MSKANPFRGFHSSPEVMRLAVMLYIRFALSLRNVEDRLHERGIDVSHETIRIGWLRFGTMSVAGSAFIFHCDTVAVPVMTGSSFWLRTQTS